MSYPSSSIGTRVAGVAAFLFSAAALAAQVMPGDTSADAASVKAVPSPLLAIDQNRATVIERVVADWGDALTRTGTGLGPEQLRTMLEGMRSDQLLAASLAGSLAGLRDVLANALTTGEREVKASLVHTKALGDANQDVVYVPVTPCRLVETRGTFPAVYQGGGAFAPNEIRSYTLQGGNGVCLTQLPAGANPSAIQLQVYGIPTTSGSGDIEILPQGGTFGSTATLVYLGSNAFTSSSATSLVNLANNQIAVQVRGGGAHVAIDVVGYFRPPQGGFVSNITAGAGLTGGGSGATSLAVDTTVIQSRVTGTCAAGSSIRAIAANGTVTCETDDVGTGTVTSVATGTGLTGGPITTTGTIGIAPGGVGATELATGAAIKSKLGASGGTNGQVLSNDGTNLQWITLPAVQRWAGFVPSVIGGNATAFAFVGPVTTIAVTAPGRRVTATASAALGVSSGSAAAVFVNICWQQTGGPVTEFGNGNFMAVTVPATRTIYTASDSVFLATPGTYQVGLCVQNAGPTTLNNNDYQLGWAMITPN